MIPFHYVSTHSTTDWECLAKCGINNSTVQITLLMIKTGLGAIESRHSKVFFSNISQINTSTHWGRVTNICASTIYVYIPTLLQIMACRLFGVKPLSESMLPYCQFYPVEHISVKFYSKFKSFHSRKCTWKCRLRNGGHFVSASMC